GHARGAHGRGQPRRDRGREPRRRRRPRAPGGRDRAGHDGEPACHAHPAAGHRQGVRRSRGAPARRRRHRCRRRRGSARPGARDVTAPIEQTMAGCVVLVTADRRSAELAAALERRGARVRHAPALGIVPLAGDEALLEANRSLLAEPPDTVVIPTGIGFRGWVEAADASGLADRLLTVLAGARLVARGPKARGAIQAAGLVADWVAESETNGEIAQVLLDEGVRGLSIAVQHHGAGSDGLDEAFAAAGAHVRSLVVYRWGPPPDPEALAAGVRAAADGEIDAVVFTSAPGAAAWLDAADAAEVGDKVVARTREGAMVAAAVGPVTARPLLERGITPLVPDRG